MAFLDVTSSTTVVKRMKTFYLLLLIALNYSCEPRIINNAKNIENVFNRNNFEIEIQNWGCLGGRADYFTVIKKKNAFILKSKSTEKSHPVSKVKMDSLEMFLKSKIGKDEDGGCTAIKYIRVGTYFNSVDYQHNFCSGIESTILNDLLNYRELTENYEDKK